MNSKNILIVDDEENHRYMLKLHLRDAGYSCMEAENGEQALLIHASNDIDLILLDIKMKVMDGFGVLNSLRARGDVTPIVMISAFSDLKTAVSAMKLGATDFVSKPVKVDVLLEIIKNILSTAEEDSDVVRTSDDEFHFPGIYSGAGLGKAIDLMKLVAQTDANVIILGESGTGKELVAKAIHDNSPRRKAPFVAVNCGALNDNLVESELFGHAKGAFTSAHMSRDGRFKQADGGTIFLDEVGELPLASQVKLLRILQEKEFEMVGSSKPVHTDARVIAATNRDLSLMVADKTFREDLYFRLAVFPIDLPPLRKRKGEIDMLVLHFIEKYSNKFGKNITTPTEEYLKRLWDYDFPGNVRELENIVERSIILATSETLGEKTLPPQLIDTNGTRDTLNLKDNEKYSIINALAKTSGNRTAAAKLLGISRRSLYYKMVEYNIK